MKTSFLLWLAQVLESMADYVDPFHYKSPYEHEDNVIDLEEYKVNRRFNETLGLPWD